jgi:hypothetical protein
MVPRFLRPQAQHPPWAALAATADATGGGRAAFIAELAAQGSGGSAAAEAEDGQPPGPGRCLNRARLQGGLPRAARSGCPWPHQARAMGLRPLRRIPDPQPAKAIWLLKRNEGADSVRTAACRRGTKRRIGQPQRMPRERKPLRLRRRLSQLRSPICFCLNRTQTQRNSLL